MGVLHENQPHTAGESKRREVERLEKPEEMKENTRTKSSESPKQGTYEITETKTENTGPAWVFGRSSMYIL